jgi:thiamine pyrophosphokinase
MNGGYIDHILNNIKIFVRTKSVFLEEKIIVQILDDMHSFNFKIRTKLSIFWMANCCITTKSLKWYLDMAELAFIDFNSYFNMTVSSNVYMQIVNRLAMFLVYTTNIIDARLR